MANIDFNSNLIRQIVADGLINLGQELTCIDIKSQKAQKFRIVEKSGNIIIVGYASVAVVDLQDEIIPIQTLKLMLKKFLDADEDYRNINLEHSSTQIGKVLLKYNEYNTKVDDKGLFIVAEIRRDLETAQQITDDILSGVYDSFSVKVEVLKPKKVCESSDNCIVEISDANLVEISVVKNPANPEAKFDVVKKSDDKDEKAEWSSTYINSLPDSAFAAIEPAYLSGESENKNCRHLPHHNEAVTRGDEHTSIDLPHLRNALARMNQVKPVTDSISVEELRTKAKAHLVKHAKELLPDSQFISDLKKSKDKMGDEKVKPDKPVEEVKSLSVDEVKKIAEGVLGTLTETYPILLEKSDEKFAELSKPLVADFESKVKSTDEALTAIKTQFDDQSKTLVELKGLYDVAVDRLTKLEKLPVEVTKKSMSDEDEITDAKIFVKDGEVYSI